MDPAEIEDLFDQLEDLSGDDSGPDVDTISVGSTPKPSLKPFFNSSKNLLAHQQQQQLELRRESGESSRIQQLQQSEQAFICCTQQFPSHADLKRRLYRAVRCADVTESDIDFLHPGLYLVSAYIISAHE